MEIWRTNLATAGSLAGYALAALAISGTREFVEGLDALTSKAPAWVYQPMIFLTAEMTVSPTLARTESLASPA